MTPQGAVDALLASILEVRPQSRQRRELLRSLIEKVVLLAEQDPDTLDLKIAETALSELVEAFELFAPYRDVKKVTIFGSARIAPGSPLYRLAHDFAAEIADQGWMVITGAGPGIMAAGIEGAGRERSFGVNILLPFEQGANQFIVDDEKLIEMRYFFTRKVMLTKESGAFAVFPGGFGTLDECFELLTLLQTGKAMPAPLVLVDLPDGTFWRDWLGFIDGHVAAEGYVSRGDERFFTIVTSAREAVAVIRNFYRNYHSLRMVGSRAVLRLRQSPTDAQLAEVNERYRDMVTSGSIERSGPLAVERSSQDVTELPRLVWEFNRRDFGALRRLIDDVNDWVP
jgi:uncharacterized protein (TIGR00730 family)